MIPSGGLPWGSMALAFWFAFLGCGADKSAGEKRSPSTGGTAPGAAGTLGAGSGGSGGLSSGSGDSQFAACVAYSEALCQRFAACGVGSRDCNEPDYDVTCPDRYFAPGSARTPATLLACAEAWSSHPCEKVLANTPPDCVSPGTRQVGQACLWGSQCESLVCGPPAPDVEHPSCGICQRLLASNEECPSDGAICPPGQACEPTTRRCTEFDARDSPETPAPGNTPDAGAACSGSCSSNLSCLAKTADAPSGVCGEVPGEGEPCAYSVGHSEPVCADGTGCSADGQCVTLPLDGAACLIDGEETGHCARGLYCAHSMTCAVLPQATEPCGKDQDGHQLACAEDSYCLDPGGEARCTELPAEGEPCVALFQNHQTWVQNVSEDALATQCATGYACSSAGWCARDTTASEGTGGAGMSAECTQSSPCNPGYACRAGACLPATYATACGG